MWVDEQHWAKLCFELSPAGEPMVASADGRTWRMVRVFALADSVTDHQVGFEVQSPTGDGCTVIFDHNRFTGERLSDLRDGS